MLKATFAIDSRPFERTLSTMALQITSFERHSKTASRDVSRIFEGFSGVKVQAEALRMAEAVKRLGGEAGIAGGLTKLTTRELEKLTSVTSETTEKMKRLGIEPPPAIRELSRELTKLEAPARGASAAVASIGTMARSAIGAFAGFGAAQALMSGLRSAFGAVKTAAIDMNASLEKSTLQFTTLMGDADRAAAHVRGLFEFAKRTPFETGPVVQASRMLETFGGSALNTTKTLELLGDAAAATSAPIEDLGFWVGRLYAALEGGQPVGEATMRLMELGVLSPQVRAQMETLAKTADGGGKAFDVFRDHITRFSGAMVQQANTWDGLTSSISDAINITLADSLRPFFDTIKAGAQIVLQALGSTGAQKAFDELRVKMDAAFGGTSTNAIKQVMSLMTAFGSAALTTVDVVGRGFSGLKVVFNLLATGVAGVIGVAVSAIDGLVTVASKLPGVGGQLKGVQAAIRDTNLQLQGIRQSYAEQTSEAWDGVKGNDAFSQTLQALRSTMSKLNAEVLSSTVVTQAAALVKARNAQLTRDEQKAANDAAEAFKKLKASMSGATAFTDAARMVDVIESIGGAQRLTTDEQRTALGVLSEAVAKYTALGQTAPKALMNMTLQLDAMHTRLGENVSFLDTIGKISTEIPGLVEMLSSKVLVALDKFPVSWRKWADDMARNPVKVPPPETSAWSRAWATLTEGLGDVLRQVPMTLARAFEGGGNFMGAIKSLASQIGTVLGGNIGKVAGGPIGQLLGEAIGSLAGPLVGKITAIFNKPAWKDVTARVGREWGVSISEGLAKSIADTSKSLFGGNRQAAEIFSLDKILGEAGGLSTGNLAQMTGKLRDLFVMVGSGSFTAAQGVEVLDRNWQAFVSAGTDKNGRLTDSLREILSLTQRFGLESKAVTDSLGSQASSAIEGFNATVAGLTEPWIAAGKSASDARKAFDDALAKFHEGQSSGLDAARMDELSAALAKATDGHTEALARQRAEAERASGALGDMGTIALATYGAAVSAGKTHAAALHEALPGLTDLSEAYKLLGLDIADAGLGALIMQGDLLKQNPKLIAGIDGLSQSFIGLSNMGLLNTDTFRAMQRTGMEMYTRLQDRVASFGGGTRDALLPMQGYLQQAAKQAELLGIPLDENTQMLIDQSKELGIWRDAGKDSTTLMLEGFDKVVAAIDRLTGAFTNDLARHADTAAAAVERAFRGRAIPALQDTADAVRDVIEERSPTGLEGVASYAGYAADAIQAMATRAKPALDRVAGGVAGIAEKFAAFNSSSVLRGLQSALTSLRGIARDDLADAQNFSLAKFQGSAGLTGKQQSLQREVALLGLKDFPKDLRSLSFQFQDEIAGLGPNPALYQQQWDRARSILQSSLKFQLEDLEYARKDAIASLGQLPAEYERTYAKSLAQIERDYTKKQRDLETQRDKDVVDVARIAKDLGITQAQALLRISAGHQELMEEARERYEAEKAQLGMTPQQYAEAYDAATRAVQEQYDQLKRRAEERAQFELDTLGMLPDEYRAQYDEIAKLVGEKYSLMATVAAESAGAQIEAIKEVIGWYTKAFPGYTPNVGGAAGSPSTGAPSVPASMSLADAIAQTQSFAQASSFGRTLTDQELATLQARFTGPLTSARLQAFLEEALAQYTAGVQFFAKGGKVKAKGPVRDTVPAMLTPGEVVLTPDAASRLARGDWPGGRGTVDTAHLRVEIAGLRSDLARDRRDLPRALSVALEDAVELGRRRR